MADIPEELYEVVAKACLYREDGPHAVGAYLSKEQRKKLSSKEAESIYHQILKDPKFQDIMEDYKKVESISVIDDDMNTIMLQYNKIIKDATRDGKYEVVARVLKEIRQLKAIEDKQMEFKMTFAFKPTEAINLEMIKNEKE